MPKNKLFLKWFLFTFVLFMLGFYGIMLGGLQWIHQTDKTPITFAIIVLCGVFTMYLGGHYHRLSTIIDQGVGTPAEIARIQITQIQEGLVHGGTVIWLFQMLGVLGTFIGIMMGLSLVSAEQQEGWRAVFGAYMSTAFLTSGAGIVAAILVKLQCHVLAVILHRRGHDAEN